MQFLGAGQPLESTVIRLTHEWLLLHGFQQLEEAATEKNNSLSVCCLAHIYKMSRWRREPLQFECQAKVPASLYLWETRGVENQRICPTREPGKFIVFRRTFSSTRASLNLHFSSSGKETCSSSGCSPLRAV